jgi:hypothetical protein
MLNRECWQVTTQATGGAGISSVTFCPVLGCAPVETRRLLGPDDRHWRGKLIREIVDDDGRHMQSAKAVSRLEAVNDDWSEFVIATDVETEYENGVHGGSGSRTRYRDVIRPAVRKVQVQARIKDGTRVILMENQQLKAEWRDGKIVRVYDGEAVKELATVKMAPARMGLGRMLGLTALVAVATAGLWWILRNRKKPAQSNERRPAF